MPNLNIEFLWKFQSRWKVAHLIVAPILYVHCLPEIIYKYLKINKNGINILVRMD